MKTNLLKWYMVAFLLVSDFVMFAQGDDNGDCVNDDCIEGNDGDSEAGLPINTKLIWLAILGVSFAFYYYKKNKEQKAI